MKGLGANCATASAIEEVVGQISAVIAAARLTVGAAVVSACPAIGVGLQITAISLAGGDRAAGVAAARSGQTARVAVALFACVQALVLLSGVAALAEGLTGIDPSGPGGFESEGAQHSPGEHGCQAPQRLAAWYRLNQRLREFVEQVVHDGSFSLELDFRLRPAALGLTVVVVHGNSDTFEIGFLTRQESRRAGTKA